MWQFDTEFSQIVRRTPSVKSFRFPISPDNAPFEPGQFFFVTILVNGEKTLHHFTISSSPTDKGYLEFTKRITAHDYSQALDNMKPGDWAHIQGPSGGFILPPRRPPLAFLTGGIGITPARSMLRYIAHEKLDYDMVLLYGNAAEAEIAFRQELDKIAASHPSIRVEHVLSGPEFPPGWSGRRGTIDKDLVLELMPDYKERLFYLSGPPKMVISLEEQLKALNIPAKNIKQDSFTGYD